MSNIHDFVFDAQARIIATVPGSDAYIITEPVCDGEHIIVHRTIGGRQNGMGTGPGEFQGPTGIALDRVTQYHIVCDTGNDRVQIFDSQGHYLRQFRTGPSPRVALVDYWGNVMIATNNGLEIYNEQGSLPIYGSIEGFVKDKNTDIPLDNALVYIVSTFDLPVQGVYTNEDGYFRLYSVPAGGHNMVVTKPAYHDTSALIEVTAGEKTEVTFYIERVAVTTPGTGNVAGTVMSQTRSVPMVGLTVGVEGSSISDLTNGNGEFLLIGVDSGPQKLQITANGTIVWEKNIQVPDGQTLDTGFIYLPF